MKRLKKKRSQAAISDAIILLLVTSFSAALIFNFIGTWGNDQDSVLRSSYVLNYMQSVSKAAYHVDASTLQNIGPGGIDVYSDLDCSQLKDYPGTLRVTDLLKRDLGDSNPGSGLPGESVLPKLDDKFGLDENAAVVPGKTAMRCAMKELMKPFAFAGYTYYFEVLSLENPADAQDGDFVPVEGGEITNSKSLGLSTTGTTPGCKGVREAGLDVLTVSSPFQVLYSTTNEEGQLDSQFVKYKTRICIWSSASG
ncbi:MAG: hypothetical protein V1717_00155 [Candidatus Micrarchaeota archaeon]